METRPEMVAEGESDIVHGEWFGCCWFSGDFYLSVNPPNTELLCESGGGRAPELIGGPELLREKQSSFSSPLLGGGVPSLNKTSP